MQRKFKECQGVWTQAYQHQGGFVEGNKVWFQPLKKFLVRTGHGFMSERSECVAKNTRICKEDSCVLGQAIPVSGLRLCC